MTTSQILITIIVSFVAACLQRISGFGFALLATPIMSIVMPVPVAVVVISFVSLPNGILNWLQQGHHADRAQVRRIVVWCITGMPIGLVAIRHIPDRPMRIVLGVVVAVAAGALASGWRITRGGRQVDAAAGFLSGILATSTGTNGPPLVIGLQGQGVTPERFRGTMAGIFVATGIVTLVLFAVNGLVTEATLKLASVGVAPMLVGQFAGVRLLPRVRTEHYRHLIVALLFASAAAAIGNALR